jgi:signal transduction histidine kinase
MYRITLLCLALFMLLAFGLVYVSSRAIARPLRQMNEAVAVIAGGDFDKRVPVRSRDEVGQLAERFNHMAASLQEQEKIRRAFIANISHDLRSPLTTMRGFLTAIQDGTVPPEKQPHYLAIIRDETERLIKLSNDILDLQRIQDTELKPNRAVFDINELIRRTLQALEQRALDKRLTIRASFAHEADPVTADADMIQRALYNLLDNAMKFTNEGGSVAIETAVADGKLTVAVQDDGRGMTEDELRHIFERFYKSDASRGEDRRGSGLGLSIVQEFIRAHGERVAVESAPGKGSRFSFALPVA